MKSIDLSIIVVNWNSKDYLRGCIASILKGTFGIEYEIIVVDTASFDGCEDMLQQLYPQVCFIQIERNVGFARANNIGARRARGSVILFLNPDTEIEDHAIEILFSQLDSSESIGIGIVGAKLLNSDKTVQTSCIRAWPNILNQVLDSKVLRKRFPGAKMWGMKPLMSDNEAAVEVDAVSGACLMIKKSVFESVGMFTTDYFMYSEDIDLCLKVTRAGYKTYYVPTAVVVHHGGASSSQTKVNTFSAVMMLESRWRFFRNTRSLWYATGYRLAMCCVSVGRITLLLIAWPTRRLRGNGSNNEAALKKWLARLRWTLGGERWVKDY